MQKKRKNCRIYQNELHIVFFSRLTVKEKARIQYKDCNSQMESQKTSKFKDRRCEKTQIAQRVKFYKECSILIKKLLPFFKCYKNNFIEHPKEEMRLSQQAKNTLPTIESTQQKRQFVIFFKSYLKYLKKNVQASSSKNDLQNSIFDLKKTSGNISLELFLQRVLSYFKGGNQAYICALCFIDRFLQSESSKTENITLNMKNIFKIVSIALLVSTKNFDDFYYTNSYYARVCGLTLQEINQLQKQFLERIGFNVFINSEQYKIYEALVGNYRIQVVGLSGQKENAVSCGNVSQLNEKTYEQQSRDFQITREEEERTIPVEVTA